MLSEITQRLSRVSQPKPAGWFSTIVLFGLPAAVFWCLFHVIGPGLRRLGFSWWFVFQVLLVLPLGALLLATYFCVRREATSAPWIGWARRLRLDRPAASAWIWAIALSGFMHGGDWEDAVATVASCAALWSERTRRIWLYAAVLIAVQLKRHLYLVEPILRSVTLFQPTGFHQEFFSHFGPTDFMGIQLIGAWWVFFFYAAWLVVFNLFGEELWWRGYVLPRQELAFGRGTWAIHGLCWSLFHLFIQPSLWDTARMAVTGMALAFVAQRTRNTWPGIIGHGVANTPLLISIGSGLT
jgi:membrane protease YdiL (CAAX protease family)